MKNSLKKLWTLAECQPHIKVWDEIHKRLIDVVSYETSMILGDSVYNQSNTIDALNKNSNNGIYEQVSLHTEIKVKEENNTI
jgi:hypothetical protein